MYFDGHYLAITYIMCHFTIAVNLFAYRETLLMHYLSIIVAYMNKWQSNY